MVVVVFSWWCCGGGIFFWCLVFHHYILVPFPFVSPLLSGLHRLCLQNSHVGFPGPIIFGGG